MKVFPQCTAQTFTKREAIDFTSETAQWSILETKKAIQMARFFSRIADASAVIGQN